MLRISAFVWLLLLAAQISSAQSTFTNFHTLDLSKQKLLELPKAFYIDKVIDNRVVKTSVGEVQKGVFNNKASAVFRAPLAQELQQFISLYHPKLENQKPVILRINKLWVSENTVLNSETGATEMLLDFIYKQDSVYYKVYTAASLTTYQGLDVTGKHEKKIAETLMECLNKFAVQDFDKLLATAQKLTPEQVTAPYTHTTSIEHYPVLSATVYKKGVYHTFEEFRSNNPVFTTGYELKNNSKHIVPVITDEKGKKKTVKNAWGFTTGTDVFINYGGTYYPLAFTDGAFTFTGPPSPANNPNVVLASSMAGGLIGGALVGGIVGGIVAATAERGVYTLDLVTGNILLDGKPVGMNTADAKLILYRGAKGDIEKPALIIVNGEEYSLQPNEYLELELSTIDAGTSICPTGEKGKCFNFMPIPAKTYYISCILSTKSQTSTPEFKVVDDALGSYEVKGIKFSQEKAAKKKGKK